MAAQAAVRLHPNLREAAVVVMEGLHPQEQVFGVNAKAHAAGLLEGMSRAEVETFGAVVVVPRSVAEEKRAEAVLLEAMGSFSPRVEARVCGVDWECVVDLAGTERLLGDVDFVGRRMVAALAGVGFEGFCCVAGNVDAGLSVARDGAWLGIADPTLATMRPSQGWSARMVSLGLEAKALAGLPLRVLRLDEEAAERFAVWGIRTLGELAALPETALIARMGQAGKQLRLRARGELPHLLKPAAEEFRLEEMVELDAEVETLEPLLFVINPMLEQLVVRAQGRALAIAAVTVELGMEEKGRGWREEGRVKANTNTGVLRCAQDDEMCRVGVYVRTVRPAVATVDRRLLLKMVQLDLEAHPVPGAVYWVRLHAEPGDASRIQLGLFAPPMPEPTRFEDTHARLLAVVGEGNVGRVRLLDTHAPEGFRLERFVLPGGGYKVPQVRVEGAEPATALRRLRPAVSVRVASRNGERGAEILAFWFEGRRYDVLRSFGPWRTSGDWWGGTVWSQDVWDLAAREVVEGELLLCLVGHDLVRDRWGMEGIYD
jgi:protein ImuB